jgi:hypothetical protein
MPAVSARTDESLRGRESIKNFDDGSKQNSKIICSDNDHERIGCFRGMRFVKLCGEHRIDLLTATQQLCGGGELLNQTECAVA